MLAIRQIFKKPSIRDGRVNVNVRVTLRCVCSLHSNSQLDINVKGGMIRDLFNLAGFLIPEKNDVLANPGPAPDLRYHTRTHTHRHTHLHTYAHTPTHTSCLIWT